MLSGDAIRREARAVGFDLCGVTPCRHLAANEARFRDWLAAGCHASLGYLERNVEKRFDPARLVEGARTAVVCAVGYKNALSGGYPPSCRTKVASYACNRDYHATIREMLGRLFERIRAMSLTVGGRAFVDSAPLCEKQLAVEAGLGWIGRQSLLVTPTLGSYVLLGELLLTEEAEDCDRPFEGSRCGSCRICLDRCPAGAIRADRTIDARRCIACRTIERGDAADGSLDGWIFGCDACQQHCPYNLRAPLHRNPAFDPLFDPLAMDRAAWEALDDAAFAERFGETPLARSGAERIRRQARAAAQAEE